MGGSRGKVGRRRLQSSIDQNDDRRNDARPTTDEPAPAPAPPKKVDLPPPEAVDKAIRQFKSTRRPATAAPV